jgi:hypothetical protein
MILSLVLNPIFIHPEVESLPPPVPEPLLNEDGSTLLNEDGSDLLNE